MLKNTFALNYIYCKLNKILYKRTFKNSITKNMVIQ